MEIGLLIFGDDNIQGKVGISIRNAEDLPLGGVSIEIFVCIVHYRHLEAIISLFFDITTISAHFQVGVM